MSADMDDYEGLNLSPTVTRALAFLTWPRGIMLLAEVKEGRWRVAVQIQSKDVLLLPIIKPKTETNMGWILESPGKDPKIPYEILLHHLLSASFIHPYKMAFSWG